MKKAFLMAIPLIVACSGCGGERVESSTCNPSVKVVLTGATPARSKATPAVAPAARGKAVQVYWDVSQSMRHFAGTRVPRRATDRAPMGEWSDELTPVVDALDSRVLLSANASVVEQYGVGESIQPLPSSRAALQPTATRTALHLAAQQIGTALATGSAQAVVVVSDMELDTPPRNAVSATVCDGVPLPSSPLAGFLFGRCFENAITSSESPSRMRTNLLVHVFRKSTHGRELFILLFATDRNFGMQISTGIESRLGYRKQAIFDSGQVAAAHVRECVLVPSKAVRFSRTGCGVKCFDPEANVLAQCEVRRPATDVWIVPAGRGLDSVSFDSLKRNAGDPDERALVKFEFPCDSTPGMLYATVSFTWRKRNLWPRNETDAFAQNASARDLFDGLADALVRTAAPRRLRIGIELAP